MNSVYTFGIIVPNYNRYELLDRTLLSLKKQTSNDFCCVIVDDGSKDQDRVRQIVGKYTDAMDITLHLLDKNNGISHARNVGAELLRDRVRFFCFLDSDDEYTADAIELRLQLYEQHPDVQYMVSDYTLIGNPWVRDKNDPHRTIHINECGVSGWGHCIGQITIDVGAFFSCGMFDERIIYAEDVDFIQRCHDHKYRHYSIDRPLLIYHREPHDEVTNM